jgi:hypothetical protein
MAGIKKCHDYSKMAANVAKQLTLAGYDAQHFKHVDVVTVTFDGIKYNVCPLPDIEQFGDIFKSGEIKSIGGNRLYIELQYDDKITEIKCYTYKLKVRGMSYGTLDKDIARYHGYVNGNMYMDYDNVWIRDKSYLYENDYKITSLYDIKEGDLLNIDDFTPATEIEINIKNEGFKLLPFSYLIESDISNVTIINYIGYFVEGKFIENKDKTNDKINDKNNNLFHYKDAESGELFVLLKDPQTRERVLASATKQVKLTRAETCLVKPVNGLYDGFKILDNISNLTCYMDEDGYFTNCDGDPVDDPEPMIYSFNHILYAGNADDERVVELKVVNPANGKFTKAASSNC